MSIFSQILARQTLCGFTPACGGSLIGPAGVSNLSEPSGYQRQVDFPSARSCSALAEHHQVEGLPSGEDALATIKAFRDMG